MTGVGFARVTPPLVDLPRLPTPLNLGERATLDALTRLGPDWHVFAQPRLSTAQPDFVVARPSRGVWVIEGKDWNPRHYRAQGAVGGKWIEVRDDDRWVTVLSPRVALTHYLQVFRDRFFVDSGTGGESSSGLGVLLVLPQFTADQARALLGRFPVVAGDDLPQLSQWIDEQDAQVPDPLLVRQLMRWLDEPEHVSDQRLPLPLSAGARDVARNPRGAQFRRVRGPAGSGKSLALASRAVELADQRKDVLLVTFNMTLVHYLHDLCSRAAREQAVAHWKHAVSFTHFHGLLKELTSQLGLKHGLYEPQGSAREEMAGEAWTAWAIGELRAAYANGQVDLPRYDAILVDEGQDFTLAWWQFLREHVLRPGGEMLLAADRTQNLYQRDRWTDSSISGAGFAGPWVELKGTYRMPADLIPIAAEFARTYLPGTDLDLLSIEADHPGLGEALAPTHRRWVNTTEAAAVDDAAREIEWLIEEVDGLSPSDIVLLADHQPGARIMGVLKDRHIDVVSLFTAQDGEARRRRKRAFWAGSPGVKGCTIHSFKGWESRAVVVVPSASASLHLYIALTRVKFAPSRPAYITVVNTIDALHPFKARFERDIHPSEVPALGGQITLQV